MGDDNDDDDINRDDDDINRGVFHFGRLITKNEQKRIEEEKRRMKEDNKFINYIKLKEFTRKELTIEEYNMVLDILKKYMTTEEYEKMIKKEFQTYIETKKTLPWFLKYFDTQLDIGYKFDDERQGNNDAAYVSLNERQTFNPRQTYEQNNKSGVSKVRLNPINTNEEVFRRFDSTKLHNFSSVKGTYSILKNVNSNNQNENMSFTFEDFLQKYEYSEINTTATHNSEMLPVAIFYAIQFYNDSVGAPDYGKLVLTVFSKPFNVSMYKFSRQNITFFLPILLALLFEIQPSNISVCFIYHDNIHKNYIVTQYNHAYGEKYPTLDEMNATIVDDEILKAQVSEIGNVTLNNEKIISTDIIFSYFFEYLFHKFGLKISTRKQKTINEQQLSNIQIGFYNMFWSKLIEYAKSVQTPGGGKKYRKISKTKRKKQRSKRRSQKKSNRSIKHRQ